MPIGFPLSITLPSSGQVQWDSPLNTALQTLIDAVEARVTVDGLNVQSSLDLQGNYLINVKGLKLSANVDDGSSRQLFFKSDGELYARDGSGRSIQLTSSGSLNIGLNGGIGGDYVGSAAQEVYSSSGTKFTFTSSPGVYATIEGGDLQIHNGSSANYTDVKSSPVIGSTYSLTLPSAVPSVVSIVTMDTTGSLASTVTPSVVSITTAQVTASYILPSRATLPSAGAGLRIVSLDPTGSIGLLPASASLSMSIDVSKYVISAGTTISYGSSGITLQTAGDAVDVSLDYYEGDTIQEVTFGTNTQPLTASMWFRDSTPSSTQVIRKAFNGLLTSGDRTLSPGDATMTGTLPYTPATNGTMFLRYELGGGGSIGGLYTLRVGLTRPRK